MQLTLWYLNKFWLWLVWRDSEWSSIAIILPCTPKYFIPAVILFSSWWMNPRRMNVFHTLIDFICSVTAKSASLIKNNIQRLLTVNKFIKLIIPNISKIRCLLYFEDYGEILVWKVQDFGISWYTRLREFSCWDKIEIPLRTVMLAEIGYTYNIACNSELWRLSISLEVRKVHQVDFLTPRVLISVKERRGR